MSDRTFGVPLTYYLVPTRPMTFPTVSAFGQRGLSVTAAVPPPPRVVVLQPLPMFGATAEEFEKLRQASIEGRPVRLVQAQTPTQLQASQTAIPQAPRAIDPEPRAVEAGLDVPSQAFVPEQSDGQLVITPQLKDQDQVEQQEPLRGLSPSVEDVSDPELSGPTDQPTTSDLDLPAMVGSGSTHGPQFKIDLDEATKRLLCAGFGQIMGTFSLPEDFSISRLREVLPHIRYYAFCAEKLGNSSQRSNGRDLLERAFAIVASNEKV